MHHSTISSELTKSGLPAPQPSLMRAPRGGRGTAARPNSDGDDDDDDDDDDRDDQDGDDGARLTRSTSQSRSVETPQATTERDGPSALVSASSSSQPKQSKADDTLVAPAVAGAGTGTARNVPFSLSLSLRNTGSVARDHLASERTFLAYVRTSLSFASAGVGPSHTSFPYLSLSKKKKNKYYPLNIYTIHLALVQLFRVSVDSSSASHDQLVVSYARPLGATLVAFGMAVLLMGESRSFFISFLFPPCYIPFRSPTMRMHSIMYIC